MVEDFASVNIQVKGRVQGVFYRASTLEKAQRLNLTGWVRNCYDGSVDITAEGPRHALEQLIQWCRQGPPMARVTDLSAQWGPYKNAFNTFMITR